MIFWVMEHFESLLTSVSNSFGTCDGTLRNHRVHVTPEGPHVFQTLPADYHDRFVCLVVCFICNLLHHYCRILVN